MTVQENDGLYPMLQAILDPYRPGDLTNLERYYFEGTTLGSRAMDEAAARLLIHSQQAGAWVAVDWAMIGRGMQWDREVLKTAPFELERLLEEERKIYRKMCRESLHVLLINILCLGLFIFLSILCREKIEWWPKLKIIDLPPDVPRSVLLVEGPTAITRTGFGSLIDKGLVTVFTLAGQPVLMPTRALLDIVVPAKRRHELNLEGKL